MDMSGRPTRCRSTTRRQHHRGEVWYAELLLLFSFKTRGHVEPEVALVRWFEPVPRTAHARNIRLQPFQHAKVKLIGIQHKVFHVDVVTLASHASCSQIPSTATFSTTTTGLETLLMPLGDASVGPCNHVIMACLSESMATD
ncbi:TPA: hypothetical protein ACH3X1_013492 [Trebouxia sp. C0004]